MKKNILRYSLLIIMWTAYTFPAMAYPEDPDSGENEQEQTSIDTWELILVIVAVALAIYFLMKYKQICVQK